MKSSNWLWLTVLAVTVAACNNKSKESSEAPERTVFFDKSAMDTTVKPGDNFFMYANGAWVKKTKIPASETGWGSAYVLRDKNEANIHHILDYAAAHDDTTASINQKVGNFFIAVDVGGLYFYLSSTDGVYTALADGATVDVNFDVESFGLDAGGLTKVTANAVSNVTVFADPNVSKAMYSATITDVSGAASYVQLFAKAPTAGLVPIVVWPLAANATLSLNFGSSGEKSYDTEDANGTLHSGMYFGFSSVAGVYDGAGSCNATAYYK